MANVRASESGICMTDGCGRRLSRSRSHEPNCEYCAKCVREIEERMETLRAEKIDFHQNRKGIEMSRTRPPFERRLHRLDR